MGKKKVNFYDELLDMFGYDYVIGYCLCSEYDMLKNAKTEENEKRANWMQKRAVGYRKVADRLIKERVDNGL